MKKILMIGLSLLYMAAEAHVVKGSYVRSERTPSGALKVICKKSTRDCILVITRVDGSGYDASVMNPNGSIAFEEACSGFYESETPEGDIEVELLP
jgi:hypothetical protein